MEYQHRANCFPEDVDVRVRELREDQRRQRQRAAASLEKRPTWACSRTRFEGERVSHCDAAGRQTRCRSNVNGIMFFGFSMKYNRFPP